MREIDLYWLLRDEPADDSWPEEAKFMERRRERILQGVPYLGTPLVDLI